MARKILLADDSVTAQNMGRKILADAGYEVIAVNNGSAALKKIAELKPELVILDVYMPGYSGLEVCQRLKESPETARIPVLLTVGKLEPFKPEEAQRVRADGYIVKPFEASELLSALSKLEDKVVPRPEPSKPGRFARAMAAAEETGRSSRNEPSSSEEGWKSRIGFPHKKTEASGEEPVADEASTHNPVNRDLRTVVDPPVAEKEEKRLQAGPGPETSVDVAALAPAGLPKDVTPEELAAITAAAAQMQMAGAAGNGEQRISENKPSFSETPSQASLEPAAERVANSLPPARGLSASNEENKIEGVASEPVVPEVKHRRRKEDKRLEETPDEPVTMAATAESVVASSPGASRWTAVSVALEGNEAAVSLDHEMQKAYAALAGADSVACASLPAGAHAEYSSALPEVPAEAPVAAISNPERDPAPQLEPAMNMQAAEANPAPVAQLSPPTDAPSTAAEPDNSYQPLSGSQAPETPALAPVTAEVEPAPEPTAISATPQSTAPNQEPTSSGDENKVAEPDAPTPAAWQLPEAEATMGEAATASDAGLAPIINENENENENGPEPKLDPETVKSTAAAWASWRQIRDTGKGDEEAQAASREFEAPESAQPETNAMAAAAGAEQILQAAVAADPNRNPEDVARIVDSVLADLRPKLMEEISRKMAEKK